MSILNNTYKVNDSRIGRDDKGLSIVELIIVIAIMAVLLGLMVLSVSMLVGSEAKQASTKMYAQINDIKTGAMSRAGEYMVVRYIEVNSANQKKMAEEGVDKSGFYVEKHISTINNSDYGTSLKVDEGGVEYTRIGSKKVEIQVDGNEIQPVDDGSGNGYKLEFDRRTGKVQISKIVTMSGTGTSATYSESSDVTLTNMTFKAGLRTYTIEFDAETGKHTLVK